MQVNGVEIETSYAEAFSLWCSRVLVTAKNKRWVQTAASVVTGFGTSIIACPVEAGVDRFVSSNCRLRSDSNQHRLQVAQFLE